MPPLPLSFRESAARDRLQTQTFSEPTSSSWATSLGALTVMASVSGICLAQRLTQQLGNSSEELFRGERLPLLPLLPVSTFSSCSTDLQEPLSDSPHPASTGM